jgi:YD repeat-containing protein
MLSIVTLRKLLTLSVLGLLLSWQAAAQLPQGVPPVQSPNSASLGLFGDVPVSLYAGLPAIALPLYTIQEGKVAIPLTLNYHASGFRSDMHPGWVGMGWNLSAGGSITRTMHDGMDETYLENLTAGARDLGFYYRHAILNDVNWEKASFIENTLIKANSLGAYNYNYYMDTEPDEFDFNFLGYSGSFYLATDGSWKVKCDKSVQVRVLTSPNLLLAPPFKSLDVDFPYLKSFTGFIITAEDGTQYQFGGSTDAIEYSTDFFGLGNGKRYPLTATSWQLTKILPTDGRAITFTYKREEAAGRFVNQMYFSVYWLIKTQVSPGGDSNCQKDGTTTNFNDVTSFQSGQLLAPVYLTTITGPTTTATFNSSFSRELRYDNALSYQVRYNAFLANRTSQYFLPLVDNTSSGTYPEVLEKLQWKKLDNIYVSVQGTRIKNFTFAYSDRSGNETIAEQQRLTLETVMEISNNGYASPPYLIKPAYRFTYNSQSSPQREYSGYQSNRVDHWGFYNGTYARLDGSSYATDYYGYREPTNALAYATLGMLTKITYPTGGRTEFEYEQPWYGKLVNEDRSTPPEVLSTRRLAGGVRIKKITSYPLTVDAPPLVKEYFYVTGYRNGLAASALDALPSSGVLSGRSQYYFSGYQNKVVNTSNTYSRTILTSQPVIPASSNRGTHVGYSEVVEKRSDGSYTRYTYSNFDTGQAYRDEVAIPDNTLLPKLTIYQPFTSNEEMRGKLLKEELYTADNVRVKVRDIVYTAFNKASDYVRSVQADAYTACASTSTDYLQEGTSYRLPTYSCLPSQETETLYDPAGNNGITTVKTTQYSPLGYRLIASESVTDSKNQTLTTAYRYPVDLSYAGAVAPTDEVASALFAMKGRNMVGLPVETVTTRNGLVTSASVQTYKWGGLNNSNILPYRFYALESAQPLTNNSQYLPAAYESTTGGRFVVDGDKPEMKLKATFTEYDVNSNPLGLLKGGDIKSSYLWGYSNTLPIAKVDNAAPNEIFHSNFEERMGWETNATPNAYTNFTYDTQQLRTGTTAGIMICPNPGDMNHSFGTAPLTISLAGPKKFILSGWIYSEGPTAQLWLFMYQGGQTRYNYSQYDWVAINPQLPGSTNKWVYLQKEIEVPANITGLNVRLTNYYNAQSTGGGRVWFDDVRLYPADAQMTTYTHQPGIGVTSISDANNKPVLYEYDALHRLSLLRDQDGNIVKSFEYHYHL